MNLPKFGRGLELVSSQLNKLSDSIRRSTITSVIGGTLTVTPGGTTLTVDAQTRGGGGATPSPVKCEFSVTDVSESNGNGGLILKIRVDVSPIEPGGRYPTGTSKQHPYKIITLGELSPSWQCVYLQIVVDQKGNILDGDAGINIYYVGNAWPESNSVIQNTYIAGFTVSDDGTGGTYISEISNYCPVVKVQPPPTCAFKIEDYSLGTSTTPKISIRSTAIDRHYPTGMDDTNTYVLNIPNTQDWFAVYAVLVTDEVGNIDFETNGVTLGLFSTYKKTSERLTYFLLGEVNLGYDSESKRVITYIYNACAVPFITGGIDWVGNVVPRARGVACRFTIYDNSTLQEQAVIVTAGVVNCIQDYRWPYEMMGGSDYRVGGISTMTYIYVSILYVTNDVVVDPSVLAVRIVVSDDLKANGTNIEYILLGIVFYDAGKITRIQNFCINATANPCNLQWR